MHFKTWLRLDYVQCNLGIAFYKYETNAFEKHIYLFVCAMC